jgi:hypothetical protein
MLINDFKRFLSQVIGSINLHLIDSFGIFKELITHTSGDFDEAIDWLGELDKEYKLNTL